MEEKIAKRKQGAVGSEASPGHPGMPIKSIKKCLNSSHHNKVDHGPEALQPSRKLKARLAESKGHYSYIVHW